MASPVTHAVVAVAVAVGLRVPRIPPRYWAIGIFCAEAPDLDAIGFWAGLPYHSLLGHRGLTHSVLFAMLLSWFFARLVGGAGDISPARLWCFLFVSTVSHGVLDAMTDGGLGVAFLSPFDPARYFLPFRPIHVSSMSLWDLLGAHGVNVLVSECIWVWIPCALLIAVTIIRRRQAGQSTG